MRKTLFLTLILLLAVAWMAAQQEPQSRRSEPQPSPTMNSGQSTAPGGAPSTQTSPAVPPAAADQSATGSSQVVEGCLGGTAPDFTVTDKAGTVYKLDIPKDADTAPLTAHVGQAVRVQGAVSDTGTAGASGSTPAAGAADKTAASAPAGKMIAAERISQGSGTCPAGAAKPPAK